MKKDVIILEPFYGGSHKQLVDTIIRALDGNEIRFHLFTLPAKKWPWKARCGALMLSEDIPVGTEYHTLFCSSDLSLSELLGIRPDLSNCHKVVYFHENQLVYPVRKNEASDFQFGFNQILTALAADEVIFNSKYNMNSFLDNIIQFLHHIPGYKHKSIVGKIRPKCKVLYFPIMYPVLQNNDPTQDTASCKVLHIVWAHRWEHDKDAEAFFDVLFQLQENGFDFQISVLGQGFTEVPSIFSDVKAKLKNSTIKNWGYLDSKKEYYSVLQSCDVAVSTARHEFFGVSMMECAYCGCYPLCPNRLVYPELYPKECLYNTNQQLYKRLREFCRKPWIAKHMRKKLEMDFSCFSWESKSSDYYKLLTASKKRHCLEQEGLDDTITTIVKSPKMDESSVPEIST